MSELYFRYGDIEGFTSNKLAGKRLDFSIPIRELLQNSLDAGKGKNQLQIDIYIEKIKKENIPHIQDYKETLEKAIETQKSKKSYNRNSRQVVAFIEEALKKKELDVLMFVDNGNGMNQKILEGLLDERSIKEDESSGGSFGVGHLTSYFLSSLRYILYATKYKEGNGDIKQFYTGSPILAGHSDNADRSGKGRIVEKKPDDETKPKFIFPEKFPKFIQSKMDKLESTGSMVAILGLSESWNDEAEYAIVSNFFHAMSHTSMNVTVSGNGKKTDINDDRIDKLIAHEKDEKRVKPGSDNILSGEAVYWAHQTVMAEASQKTLVLSNGDKAQVYINNDVDSSGSTIVLIRNGMVIARHDSMLSPAMNNLRRSDDYKPFMAVVDVDQKDAPKLFTLVKGAEGPYHNKLERKRLIEKDEKKLKKLFEELSEKIKEYLIKIERTGFDLPLFNSPNSEAIKRGGTPPASTYPEPGNLARKIKQNETIEKNSPEKEDNREKRQAPVIHPRRLQSRKAMRYSHKGAELEVKIKITPTKQSDRSDKDSVYLSIALAEDNDKGRVREFVEFIDVSVNRIPCGDFEDTKRLQVKLDKLNEGENYEIIAYVKKPAGFEDMKVALKPIFSLKQEKGRRK